MPAKVKTEEHLLTKFAAKDWTGRPAKGASSIFVGMGCLTFIVCLVLMIFIVLMRNPLVIICVCLVLATLVTVSDIANRGKREKLFLGQLAQQVNEMILEMTGDPAARISVMELRKRIEHGKPLPLRVNGVPGVEFRVDGKAGEERRIIATVTEPDYGLESFDLLLDAECQRKP